MDEDETGVGQGGQPLVTVERQVEQNLFTGERVTKRFVKMYFEARESGLLADIPDELWKTLCALATYIDEDGRCFPSQATLAKDLGIGRQAANKRITRLRDYRFQGQAVLAIQRERVRSKKGQTRWGKNVYRLLPMTGFRVGVGDGVSMSSGGDLEEDPSMSSARDIENPPEITQDSSHADLSMSPSMSPLTRHEQEGTRVSNTTHTPTDLLCVSADGFENGRELVEIFHEKRGSTKSRRPTGRELEQAGELVSRLGFEAAKSVVEFALLEAPKTKFEMKHFGAVLGYEGDGLAKHAEREQAMIRRAHEERKAELQRAEERYVRWRHQVAIEAVEATPPERLSALEASVREKLTLEHGSGAIGLEGLIRLEVRERVAAAKAIPSFEEWCREERSRARRPPVSEDQYGGDGGSSHREEAAR